MAPPEIIFFHAAYLSIPNYFLIADLRKKLDIWNEISLSIRHCGMSKRRLQSHSTFNREVFGLKVERLNNETL
jgi:hypothetical protein